ncbi:S1 family peptidase [Pigmentibacter sp. JX0631]|uniref:S1 family peptidase n=1 Tax=Pigmentibacter sp. JX0631 TaxID=2976982 RepID=UPI00246906A1|nr:S1 family peptidase [Pigmentibacter sp. JX0631]WGL61521.1 S1 family peptidase [Pigmentibacter sp. JX0631]
MKRLLLLSCCSFFLFSSCKEQKEEKKVVYTCSDLYADFDQSASNKIHNGCENNIEDVAGSKSSVYISLEYFGNDPGFCTGVAISDKTILTAAHCFETIPDRIEISNPKNSSQRISGKFIANKLFTKNPFNKDDQYSSYVPIGDIAIIKTTDSLTKINILPAKIATKYQIGERIITIGFGRSNENNENSGNIKRWTVTEIFKPNKKVELNVEQLNHYNKPAYKYEINRSIINDVGDTFITTKRLLGQTCNGDSGGGHFNKKGEVLTVTQGINTNVSGLQAVPDKNDGCMVQDAVTTYIYPYLDWIKANLSPGEKIETTE